MKAYAQLLNYLLLSMGYAFIFFLVLNVVVGIAYGIKDVRNESRRGALAYGDEIALKVYPDMTRDEIQQLMNESWLIQYEYEPYLEYTLSEQNGTYVNIDEQGFRKIANQEPWPPNPDHTNIFLFGGSTTFGAGVPDNETFASFLQERLRLNHPTVAVYNFGIPGYQSTQERILFEQLLLNGFVPDVALFFDGLNDLAVPSEEERESNASKQIKTQVSSLTNNKEVIENVKKIGQDLIDLIRRLPLQRILLSINYRLHGTSDQTASLVTEDTLEQAQRNIDYLFTNWKIASTVATTFDTETVFLLQPTPAYRHHEKQTLFPTSQNLKFIILQGAYQTLNNEVPPESPIYENLSTLQVGEQQNLYVDGVHYNSYFNSKIADAIVFSLSEMTLF